MSLELEENILEELLTGHFSISKEQIKEAKGLDAQNRLGLMENLLTLGHLNETQSVDVQAEYFATGIARIQKDSVDPELSQLLPLSTQKQYLVFPLSRVGDILNIATPSLPQGRAAQSHLQQMSNCLINFVLVYPTELRETLGLDVVDTKNTAEPPPPEAGEPLPTEERRYIENTEDPQRQIVQILTTILDGAVANAINNIHFEPLEDSYRVRQRKEGTLNEVLLLDKSFADPMTALLKWRANLNTTETHLPQKGTFRTTIAGRDFKYVVTTYPTVFGEKIVFRASEYSLKQGDIDSLLLPEKEKQQLTDLLKSSHGLVLCAGPTGFDRTPLLYSLLNHLNHPSRNIVTIEDPIEDDLPGISQAQVDLNVGLTFATALQTMLSLDPDVILLGEMKDTVTAMTAFQASLNGPLLLSGINAKTISQTVNRLLRLGLEPMTIASSLKGVIFQRLARRICTSCKSSYKPSEEELETCGYLQSPPPQLYRATGCDKCHHTGYWGTVPLIELLFVTSEVRERILQAEKKNGLSSQDLNLFIRSLNEDARQKAIQGLLSTEEILRVAPSHQEKPNKKETKAA